MSKLRFARSILAIPVLFLPIQAQTVETKSASAIVSGRIMLKGEPAQGVSVVLQPHANNPDAVLRARTDGAGRFHIVGVAAGRYSIAAFAPGAISPSDMSFSGKPQPGKTIDVSDGENVENIELTLITPTRQTNRRRRLSRSQKALRLQTSISRSARRRRVTTSMAEL